MRSRIHHYTTVPRAQVLVDVRRDLTLEFSQQADFLMEAVVRQDLGVAVQPSGAEIEATWALAAVLLQGYAHEDAAAGTCCGTVGDPESSALLCVLQCAAHLPVPCNVFRHVMVCAPHSFKHTCAHFHTHTQVAVRVAER